MGRSGGFHREVCIDKLEFADNGDIIKVKPTFEGIAALEKYLRFHKESKQATRLFGL